MADPLVSIVVPTYNRAQYVRRALDSVLAQSVRDWELLLIDDGSTDETPRIAANYARELNDRFAYLRQTNQGSSAARNRGIDAARGRFVAFLDSDDEFLPNKLERQLRLFEIRPDLGFAYSDYIFLDIDGSRYDRAMKAKWPFAGSVPHAKIEPGLCICTGDLFDSLLQDYFIATIVGMVRRDVLGTTIRFPVQHAYAEEWLFYLKVAKACPAGFVDEALCVHHATAGSLARTDKQSNTRQLHDLLQTIRGSFLAVARRQRKSLNRQLARTCRQLGFNAARHAHWDAATRHWMEAFRYHPSMESARAIMDGIRHTLLRPPIKEMAGIAPASRRLRSARTWEADDSADSVNSARTEVRGSRGLPPARGATSGRSVWKRVWLHTPSSERDDQLLARERRNPRWARIVEQIESAFGTCAGLKTIELGAGRGDLSALLAERGAKVTLLDASDEALDQAHRRFRRLGLPASFVKHDFLGTLDTLRSRYDVALSSGVVEHFRGPDRTQAIKAHHDVLAPGGMAVISVPHAWCVPYRLWKLYCELRQCWPYGLEVPFARGDLLRRSRLAGLSRPSVSCFGFWQSVGDHLAKRILGRGRDWVSKSSMLDPWLGATLVLVARRPRKTEVRGSKFETSGPRSSNLGPALIEKHFLHRGSGPEFEMEADWFRRHLLRTSGPILDIGCGNGALLSCLDGRHAIGVDVNAAGLALTRRRCPTMPLICSDAAELPFADGSLAAITLQHVVEHLPDAAAACREWYRVLQAGGVLLLATPNAYFGDPGVHQDPTHTRVFDPREIAALLGGSGLDILDLRTLGLGWFREYGGIPGLWRMRRLVIGRAPWISSLPHGRWKGQTLCCAARKP